MHEGTTLSISRVTRLPPTRVQTDQKMAAEYCDADHPTRACALADELGIDAPALGQTVAGFNGDR